MDEQREDVGALVISLDFELHWGLRDLYRADDPYIKRILHAREVIPKLLDLFEKHEIAATWAVVGFLFAKSRAELAMYSPKERPNYIHSHLNPYREIVGDTECEDPLNFASSLIKQIQQ
ncbi:hypothetical protein [Bacillus taeanensis]|uniref:Uncharacterized protein n=1 Tax=Bacillus taeanensis TaxID=273032 RepID=A0A366XPH5_9BACI|nr:hypothetical protein [Bacillus taeanensis]RBW68012.1 hypothetical protein DS031_18925 [Bacillus taeanensis]